MVVINNINSIVSLFLGGISGLGNTIHNNFFNVLITTRKKTVCCIFPLFSNDFLFLNIMVYMGKVAGNSRERGKITTNVCFLGGTSFCCC